MKLHKHFQFTLPLIQTIGRTTEHVGDLLIEGVAYCYPNRPRVDVNEKYDFDIDYIKWAGVDIKPVLDAMDVMDEINEATLQHTAYLFNQREVA